MGIQFIHRYNPEDNAKDMQRTLWGYGFQVAIQFEEMPTMIQYKFSGLIVNQHKINHGTAGIFLYTSEDEEPVFCTWMGGMIEEVVKILEERDDDM